MQMAGCKMPVTKISEILTLKEKDESWSPDKSNLNVLENRGYTVEETIGEGKFSKVKKAFCNRTKETVAIKVVYRSRLPLEDRRKFIPREIEILTSLQHPGLLDMLQLFECGQTYYLVMQYAPNGDLTEFINALGSLGEADSRRIFKQLLSVVAYLHRNNICHRDIKCDNILLDENFNLKLADFGFARRIPKHGFLDTNCGSYVYTAPEVLDGEEYDGIAADIWSTGICLYCMLCGKLPYRNDDIDILRCSMAEKLKFVRYVSKDCRRLLRQILNYDPNRRPSVGTILKHNWMCKPLKGSGDSSVSAMAVETVTENHAELDPSVEHGFTCNQQSTTVRSSRVKNVLESVAEVHSTGGSTVDMTKIPQIRKNSSAALTGVTGPMGRRLSQQIIPGGDGVEADQNMKTGGARSKFGGAIKKINKFKNVARVVTVVNRFRRGPLNTILKMPQEQALQKVADIHLEDNEREQKALQNSVCGKVAKRCQGKTHEQYECKMKPVREETEREQLETERQELLWSAMFHVIPPV